LPRGHPATRRRVRVGEWRCMTLHRSGAGSRAARPRRLFPGPSLFWRRAQRSKSHWPDLNIQSTLSRFEHERRWVRVLDMRRRTGVLLGGFARRPRISVRGNKCVHPHRAGNETLNIWATLPRDKWPRNRQLACHCRSPAQAEAAPRAGGQAVNDGYRVTNSLGRVPRRGN
jgi:hypothetical protein